MEGFLYFWTGYINQYKKKYVTLINFIFIINEYNNNDNTYNEELKYHIKYFNIDETCEKANNNLMEIIMSDNKQKLYFKSESEEDKINWINAINNSKLKYDKFLDDYYINNKTENLISENSFYEYLQKNKKFIIDIENQIEGVTVNPDLDNILQLQNEFLGWIDYFNKEIDKFNYNLNSNLGEELHIIVKSKEIKTLFDELKELISNCVYGLNTEEINLYLNKFKQNFSNKIQEIYLFIDEIKYIYEKYIANYLYYGHKSSFNTQEEYLFLLNLENEELKIKIDDKKKESEIIKLFIEENDYL